MSLKLDEKQEILEIQDPRERIEHIMSKIEGEIDLMQTKTHSRPGQAADGKASASTT